MVPLTGRQPFFQIKRNLFQREFSFEELGIEDALIVEDFDNGKTVTSILAKLKYSDNVVVKLNNFLEYERQIETDYCKGWFSKPGTNSYYTFS